MSQVLGKNITLLVSGDSSNGLYLIGCEESCTVTFNTDVILTTTRGSGKFRGRDTGLVDVSIQSNGVIFINATSNPDSNADPMFFASAILEGKKCIAKWQVTDGFNSRFYIGRFVIQTATYTGAAEGFATYDVTLLNDGDVYKTDDLKTLSSYNPQEYFFAATSTVTGFSNASLQNVDVYAIFRNGSAVQLFESIQVLALSTDLPTGSNTVGYHASSGTFRFSNSLVNGDTIVILYN